MLDALLSLVVAQKALVLRIGGQVLLVEPIEEGVLVGGQRHATPLSMGQTGNMK
ncbi:MAG TPA: hypothetical protein VKZ43_00720 [Trueperaceae bacterium]|nr:hypothetical protein [Trueperaceae bacterium]